MNSTRFALSIVMALLLAGCGGDSKPGAEGGGGDDGIVADTEGARIDSLLLVVDESGTPVADARVSVTGKQFNSDAMGRVSMPDLPGPSLAVVTASGYLDQPVLIGRNDQSLTVRLIDSLDGRRWSYHAGGDVMLARRYLESRSGEPLLDPADPAPGSIAVVSDLAPLFRAATVKSLNFESVASDLPDDVAYPGKRFILNTPTAALAGIASLDPDVVILANNHIRDFLDVGVQASFDALNAAGLAYTGAAVDDAAPADAAHIVEVAGLRVGFYALTTVNGEFVNNAYPVDSDSVPGNLDSGEAFQYEFRRWGFSGANVEFPEQDRRIGSAWRLFRDAEDDLSEEQKKQVWTSLSSVYPELQDWVAIRGHGGAAFRSRSDAQARIQALKEQVDLVIVNLHSGFQFSESPSQYLLSLSRSLIDGGASLVVAHHPHVLQGAEFYRDGLIVFSLGNLIFDQDFLSTFSSAVLRVVFDGAQILEAGFIPVEIAGYRPVPASDEAAAQTLKRLWERSAAQTDADRDENGAVRDYLTSLPAESVRANFRIRDHIATIVPDASPRATVNINLGGSQTTDLAEAGLVDMSLGNPTSSRVDVGKDLFGWGHFEDNLTDAIQSGGTHMALSSNDEKVIVGQAYQGDRFLRLRRGPRSLSNVVTRSLARVTFKQHRFWTRANDVSSPADPTPRYSIRFAMRLVGAGRGEVKVSLFNFFDADPTEDPETTPLGEISLALPESTGPDWQLVELELPAEAFAQAGVRANAALVYFSLERSGEGETTLDIDDYTFIEWRQANQMPASRFGDFRFAHNRSSSPVSLNFEVLQPN